MRPEIAVDEKRRRVLIDKHIEGTLTPAESEEYEALQAAVDERIRPILRARIAHLQEAQREMKASGQWIENDHARTVEVSR